MASAQAVGRAALPAAQIRKLALEAGFSDCGFARATPLPPGFLVQWLEEGYAADMDWMAARAADRLDPSRLLPGARTVVALSCNYARPEVESSVIASYARGRDYHATLRDRLRRFRRALQGEFAQVRTYASLDYTPLAERVWAALAGLGYVGRNGCLITEQHGSWVVLAAMVLDAEVDAYGSGPLPDRCGGCSLCISSCPTQAIVADATVDSRRCLSFQTIENRESIPAELRSAMEQVVFGCDICQDVCPLNRHPVTADPRFAPRPLAALSVRELACLTPEAYQQLIPGSALARAKYDGLRRNAAYALGAAKDLEARPILEQLAADASERVAEAARWALAQLRA